MNTPHAPAPAALIKTKFSPPRLTRAPVHREQAMQQLAAGLARAFTLVKAPAGFGKTTLLTAWRDTLLSEGRRVAWLTLDQDDNDENRFVEYLGGTLAATLADDAPEFGNLSRLVSVRVQLTSIINLLDQWGEDLTLILDDYDKITAPRGASPVGLCAAAHAGQPAHRGGLPHRAAAGTGLPARPRPVGGD